MKPIAAINTEFGFDLVTERDNGNQVRILTGSKSLEFWERLKNVCDAVIDTIESGETAFIERIDPYEQAIIDDRKKRKGTKQGIGKH